MTAKPPSSQTTLVVFLGASAWPLSPTLDASRAFLNSARKLRRYFLDPSQFGLPLENFFDFFDSDHSPDKIDSEIGQRITGRMQEMKHEEMNAARDIIVYFTGHGLVDRDSSDFYLAIRSTRTDNMMASAIRMKSLAFTLKEKARYLRRIVILDCCFSGAASQAFQSGGVKQVAFTQALDAFTVEEKGVGYPERGTSLLCSASNKTASLLSHDNKYTMFSEALVSALSKGHPRRQNGLSLQDVASLTRDALDEMQEKRPEEKAPRPEVHSPDQSYGNVATVPFFPNPAWKGVQYSSITPDSASVSLSPAPGQSEGDVAVIPNSTPAQAREEDTNIEIDPVVARTYEETTHPNKVLGIIGSSQAKFFGCGVALQCISTFVLLSVLHIYDPLAYVILLPIFFGAIFGPWAGFTTGSIGFLAGSFLYYFLISRNVSPFPEYSADIVYLAIDGFLAGFSYLITHGDYKSIRSIVWAASFGVLGALIAGEAHQYIYGSMLPIIFHENILNADLLALFRFDEAIGRWGMHGIISAIVFLPVLLVIYRRSKFTIFISREGK